MPKFDLTCSVYCFTCDIILFFILSFISITFSLLIQRSSPLFHLSPFYYSLYSPFCYICILNFMSSFLIFAFIPFFYYSFRHSFSLIWPVTAFILPPVSVYFFFFFTACTYTYPVSIFFITYVCVCSCVPWLVRVLVANKAKTTVRSKNSPGQAFPVYTRVKFLYIIMNLSCFGVFLSVIFTCMVALKFACICVRNS